VAQNIPAGGVVLTHKMQNAECQIGIYGAADAAQMENGKCKIENDGVRFAHETKSFPKEIPSFSTFNFQFSIRTNGAIN
jgi:hypothetical protein